MTRYFKLGFYDRETEHARAKKLAKSMRSEIDAFTKIRCQTGALTPDTAHERSWRGKAATHKKMQQKARSSKNALY